MGDEMLSVFYTGDIFTSHGKLSSGTVTNIKASLDEKSEFRLFRDYFGLIHLVQNTRLCDGMASATFGDVLYDFTYTRRARGDSVGSDRSYSSSSSNGNTEMDLNLEGLGYKAPGSGAPPRALAKRSEVGETGSRSRKNRENKKNRNANVCVFCRNNGESKKVYSSHVLKDAEGCTTCPILRAYTCPLCKASGDQSHTIKYCPRNKNASKQPQAQQQQEQQQQQVQIWVNLPQNINYCVLSIMAHLKLLRRIAE